MIRIENSHNIPFKEITVEIITGYPIDVISCSDCKTKAEEKKL